jgi:hypothetical protein
MSKGINIKFGSSKHGQGKTFCIQPFTYGTENKRPRTKKISFNGPCMEFQAQSLEAQSMAHANFLVVRLLLSNPKVRC